MTSSGPDRGPVDHLEEGFAWREAGDGPTALFLHGLGLTRTGWEPQLAGLSDSRRCVAWDMPGYGNSVPLEHLTFESVAGSVARFLDVIEVDGADLVGLSFGGMHALHTALHHPDRVRRVVVASTSPAFGLDGTDADQWRRARLARLDAGETTADIAADVLASVAGDGIHPATLHQLAESFARIPDPGLRAACELLPTHDLRDHLGDIAAPTLVVVGEHDAETPVAYAQALASGLPDCELTVMDGIGHLVAAEAPARFNDLVRRFLDDDRSSGNV